MPRGANPRLGILLKIGSVLGFTVMAACVKASAAVVPISRGLLLPRVLRAADDPRVPRLARRAAGGDLHRQSLGPFLARPARACRRWGSTFAAIAYLPLPDAIALGYAMPLFLTILAALMLGEVVRAFRWTAVLIGLGGVLIILWPRLAFLKGGGGRAGRDVRRDLRACRRDGGGARLGRGEPSDRRRSARSTVVFYFSLICSVGFLLTAPFGWRMPDAWTLAILVRERLPRRRLATAGDAELSLRRHLRRRAVRIHLDAVRHRAGLRPVRRRADGDDAARLGDRDRSRA